ncbi:MAG TPA: hypothetical protein VKV73_17340 [Chloroflexota bacterium]|nr:hypothetical protein [Chloroflexota bacterium]
MNGYVIVLLLGIALAVFGAVLLVRYPDRQGGTIKALSIEVTAPGAGVVLVVLGLGAAAYSAPNLGSRGPDNTGPTAAPVAASPATATPVAGTPVTLPAVIAAPCAYLPVRGFGLLWKDQSATVRPLIGCPSDSAGEQVVTDYHAQRFEHGVMLSIDDPRFALRANTIVVLLDGPPGAQHYEMVAPQWEDIWGDFPPTGAGQPPSGLFVPRGRFGKAWQETDGGALRQRLGWATDEQRVDGAGWDPVDPSKSRNASAQRFERGILFWIGYKAGTPAYLVDRWIYVIVNSAAESPIGDSQLWMKFPDIWAGL